MKQKLSRYINIINTQKNKSGFIASRLLMKSGLSKHIVFSRSSYKLRFHPSALTASLWVNPKERLGEETFLRSLVARGDVVVDVGANVGTVALTFANASGESGSVYAFEPHPKVFGYLQDNVLLNHAADQVRCFCMALGEKPETLYFSEKSDDTNNAISRDGGIEVKVCRLDDVIDEPRIKLLKIDVEGHEYQVLQGAVNACKSSEIIYLECIAEMLEKNGGSEEKICLFLKDLGFDIFQVIDDTLIPNVIGSHRKKMILAKR